MKNKTVTIIIILVIIVIVLFFALKKTDKTDSDNMSNIAPATTTVDTTTPAAATGSRVVKDAISFVWGYKLSETATGLPHSEISLTARYVDGTKETKKIGGVDATCNDYEDKDKDAYSKSTMIICYAAGYGQYYKIVRTSAGYNVMRKEFEEATPELNPPMTGYTTVATF